MTIERQPISEFRHKTLQAAWPSGEGLEKYPPGTLLFIDTATGEVAGQINPDDLFDPAGNRFWLDA